jgi:hypothetical protein
VAFAEIVENRDRVARVEQFLHANAADITCAACDKNVHKGESYEVIIQQDVSLGNWESAIGMAG